MTEQEFNDLDVQNTKYTGVFLGCKKVEYKNKPGEYYGVITLYFNGIKQQGSDAGSPWFSVQDQYLSVADMERITNNIPFGSKVNATYTCGNTPGGKQHVCKLEPIA